MFARLKISRSTIKTVSKTIKTSRRPSLTILALLIASSLISPEPASTAQKSQQRSLETGQTNFKTNTNSDVEALVELGPRITGTQPAIGASNYIRSQFKQAGYVTEVQTFTYSKFIDRGSSLTVGDKKIEGLALRGSPAQTITAPGVTVPNFGREEDFQQVDVRGAIAIVQRGEIEFVQKAKNAAAAGAVGLVIVNHEDDNFLGTLGSEVEIPVFSLGGVDGKPLLTQSSIASATLEVRASQAQVTGRNIIAYQPGVTQPEILLGAHYDSVADSPGANDNSSGTAVVLDLARKLAQSDLGDRVWFVAFDGEEDGLYGSRALVDAMGLDWLAKLQGMFNFDMVGVNSQLMVSGTASLTDVVQQTNSSVSPVGFTGGSDHIPFQQADVPTIFFTRGLDPNYHSPEDLLVDSQLIIETSEVALDLIKEVLMN